MSGLGGDLVGGAILGGVFVAFLVAAELWRRLGTPEPEWTRKLVHLGGGIACLLFPFLVRSPWVVLVMAVAMCALFALAARYGFLKALHGVGRSSRGAEYYPLAVFLVFLLTRDRPWLYLAAVLVLAVGDAFAALVGGRYGVIRYQVEHDHKSLEGSLVFMVITFLAVHLPLLLMTDLPRPVCVLAATLVAVLATGFEAISLGGADNLFVPLAVVVVVDKITSKPLAEVVYQNLSLLALCAVVAMLVARFPFFNVGSTIAVVLYAYANWSLGSWLWAMPVLVGLLAYLLSWVRVAAPRSALQVRVRATARALLAPFAVLVAANVSSSYGWYFGPYLAASAAVLAFAVALPLVPPAVAGPARFARCTGAAALAVVAVLAPPWAVVGAAPLAAAAVAAVTLAAAWVNAAVETDSRRAATDKWTAARFLLSLAAAGLVLALQHAGLVAPWPL